MLCGAVLCYVSLCVVVLCCTHTHTHAVVTNRWKLDLGKTVFIKNVTLHGVLDGPKGLSDDLILMVGDGEADDGQLNPSCGGPSKKWHAGHKAPVAGEPKIDVQCNLQGRYLVIKKHPGASLGIVLCEVQVWKTGWEF